MSARRASGFSLLEVMIAVVVTSVGLLGIASLQLFALRTQNNAYLRGQATQINHDMLERLRADCAGALSGAYDIAFGAVPGAGADLASTELRSWRALVARLPAGEGAVQVTNGGAATIRLRWNDARGDAGAENPAAGALLEFAETTRVCR